MVSYTHLEMIKVYLNQELPNPYNTLISVENGVIVINLSEHNDDKVLVDDLRQIIVESLDRIRNLDQLINVILKMRNEDKSFQVKVSSRVE